jgi:hypothetical protein
MLFSASNEKSQSDCMKALGLTDLHQDPAWPLPNMKPSDEKSFWGWRSSYSFNAEAWCGSKKVGDEWATILVYYLGHSDFIGGGFAVAVFRTEAEKKTYYIVWNEARNEGFVTDDFNDARMVRSGRFRGAYTTAGSAFQEADADEDLGLQTVEIAPIPALSDVGEA